MPDPAPAKESKPELTPAQLPFLLRLLDDPSPTVRKAVLAGFAAFGPALEPTLDRLPCPPDAGQWRMLRRLLAEHRRAGLREAWPSWRAREGDPERLEAALTLIAEFQNGPGDPVRPGALLDALAAEYRLAHARPEALSLARFLFREKGITGARDDYYNPFHSNLAYVIARRRGIPISLAAVHILVARRLGLAVTGCHFPGHFLSRARTGGRAVLVDGFNGGRVLDPEDLAALGPYPPDAVKELAALEADAEGMVARVLRNLVVAYRQAGDGENSELMEALLEI